MVDAFNQTDLLYDCDFRFGFKFKVKFRIIYRRLVQKRIAYRDTHVGAFNLEF